METCKNIELSVARLRSGEGWSDVSAVQPPPDGGAAGGRHGDLPLVPAHLPPHATHRALQPRDEGRRERHQGYAR